MEDTHTTRSNTSRVGDYDAYTNPCYFLREAVSAILKCLGFDDTSKPYVDDDDINNNHSSCSKEKDNNNFNNKQQSCSGGQGDKSSYNTSPVGQPSPSDPPSTTMDPPDDPSTENLARRGRTPPRPGISTGRDPQTNFTSS